MTALAIIAGIPVGIIALIGIAKALRWLISVFRDSQLGVWCAIIFFFAILIGLLFILINTTIITATILANFFIPLVGPIGGWFAVSATIVLLFGGAMILQTAMEGQN